MKTWKYDYKNCEFEMTPSGKIKEVEGVKAWEEWCKKALLTERYYYFIYDHNFGQDFEILIGTSMPRELIEMEIKRIVEETLKQHPYTSRATNFKFEWKEDECYFTCEVESINGEMITLEGEVNANT